MCLGRAVGAGCAQGGVRCSTGPCSPVCSPSAGAGSCVLPLILLLLHAAGGHEPNNREQSFPGTTHASSHSSRAGVRVLQKHPVLEVATSWTGMGEHPSCWCPGSNHNNKERFTAYPIWISSSLGEVLEQGPEHSWFCTLVFQGRLRKC